MNVTLRQLRVFIEVARRQSFSRAGDEIGLTQSAVSRCVRELEAELGLKLIDRTTREVQLTDAGSNLVASVSRLLTDLDDALREIREIGEQRRGRVVVAASPTIACRLMPQVIAACSRQFPYIALGLRDDVQTDVVRKVKSGEVDFGVVVGPIAADDLSTETLMIDSFCVVSRADHRLAQLEQVEWKALDGERLVMLDYASGSRPIIDAAMTQAPARLAWGRALFSQGRPVGKTGAMNNPTPAYATGASPFAGASRRHTVMPAAQTVRMRSGEWRRATGTTRKRPAVIISQYTEVADAATVAP